VDFNLHIPANVLLMAFVFGVLANDSVIRDREPTAAPLSHSLWRMLLPLLGAILLLQVMRLFPGEYYAERARAAVRDWRSSVGILNANAGLKYDLQNPDLHRHLGAAQIQLGARARDPVAAQSFRSAGIKAFEEARALAPREEIYAFELASALDEAGRFEEAESVYYDLFLLDPRSDSRRRSYDWHLERWRRSGSENGTSARPNS
jgi:tetratricopeptide (TPR) repeat protein